MRTEHKHSLIKIKKRIKDLQQIWGELLQKLHAVHKPSQEKFEKLREPIELFEGNCQQRGINPRIPIYD